MVGSRGTAVCVLPLHSWGLKWQSLDAWVGDRVGMYVGQGPALKLLSAAFVIFSLSLFPQRNWWKGRCTPVLH